MTGVHRDLVGERRERRQDAGAAHDDAVLGVADLVERHRVAGEDVVGGAVDRRVDDRVRERDVFARELLLEVDQVVVALFVATVRAEPRAALAREAGEGHVHVVGRAAHEADRRLGDAHEPLVPAFQVLDRPGDHVAHVDRLARLGIGHEAVVGILVLPVEHRRELMRGPAERGMVDDVVDPLVSEPHLALARLQTLEELLTRARAHAALSAIRG